MFLPLDLITSARFSSLIQIDDVNVRNLLVDRVHAERQVLCQTLGDAQQLSRQSMDQRDQDATFLSLDPLYKVFKKCVCLLRASRLRLALIFVGLTHRLGTESANYVEPWKGGASLFAVDHSVDIRSVCRPVARKGNPDVTLCPQEDRSRGL